MGGRLRNSCVPGGALDPLMPNSMRRGDTSRGTVLAGGGGWASCPTDGGGVLECAFQFGASGLHTNKCSKREHRSRQGENSSAWASRSLREVEPPVRNLGVRPDPFWDNRSVVSGLSRASTPAQHLPDKRVADS
jgi:hypothetical protein